MDMLERAVPTDGKIRYMIGEVVHHGYYHLYEGNILHSEKGLQNLMVVENPFWKKIFFINGLVQFTLKDEFIYHEALSHVALNALPEGRARRIFICGGGDLGVAREVLKYKDVEEVIVADIDPKVTGIVRKFFPELLPEDPYDKRLKIIHIDAFKIAGEFLKEGKTFDIIVVDSTDPDISSEKPVELSHSLFGKEFHEILKKLAPEGIVVQQAGTPFTMKNVLEIAYQTFKEVYSFDKVFCYRATVPSFGGDSAFVIYSARVDPRYPGREEIPYTRYYNHELHTASFVLPKYWAEVLK